MSDIGVIEKLNYGNQQPGLRHQEHGFIAAMGNSSTTPLSLFDLSPS